MRSRFSDLILADNAIALEGIIAIAPDKRRTNRQQIGCVIEWLQISLG